MATIISILATDVVSDSRADLNTNFANLNTDKAETDQTMYIGTTAVAINRGTAALTLAGLTLTTPDIGTPSAGVLTNCSGTASSLTAGSVTNATLTTALTVNTGTVTLTGNVANSSVLTIGAGAVDVSGSNTGDQDLSGKADVDQTMYIGTTAVAINRTTAALTLAGITLTTPDLGTPSAVVLTNASGTAANLTAGDVTGLDITAGQTLTVTTGGTIGTGAYATIADYAPLAGATFTGLVTIDQNADAIGLDIDSEATSVAQYGLRVITGQGARTAQFATDTSTNVVTIARPPSDTVGSNHFFRNLASGDTGGPVVFIEQDNAGDDQNALNIQQDGTGNGLFVDQNGDGLGLNIDSEATTATNYGLRVLTGQGADAALIGSNTSNSYIKVTRFDSSEGLLHVYRNLTSATTAGPVAEIIQDNAGDDQPSLQVLNDGTGTSIHITQTQDVEVIDFDACTDGGTTHTTLAGSVKVQMPNGTTGYINLYT